MIPWYIVALTAVLTLVTHAQRTCTIAIGFFLQMAVHPKNDRLMKVRAETNQIILAKYPPRMGFAF